MAARDLLIRLVGDASSAKKAMAEAEGSATKMGGTLGKVGAVAAAGVAAIGAGAVALGADSLKAFDSVAGSVSKLQRLTGGSAEDMSRLAFEAKETGVSQETLEKSLGKVSKAMVSNNKLFAEHGIATRDAKGNLLPLNDVMANAADAFSKMQNGADKNNLALQLFGRSGLEMLPMLNRGRDGLAELSKESDKFGLTLGQKSVDAYKKNVIAGREMHAAMEGLKVQIGEKLMPIVTKITSWLSEHLPQAMEFVRKAIDALQPAFDFLAAAVQVAFDVVSTIVGFLIDHKDILLAVGIGILATLVPAFIAWAAGAAAAAVATIAAAAPVIAVGIAIAALVEGIIYAYHHFKFFHDAIEGIKLAFEYLWHVAGEAWDWIKGKWGEAVSVFSVIWTAIKDGFAKVEGWITAPFRAAFNAVASLWNATVGGFGFSVPDWVPFVGGDSFKIPKMPHLAAGGTMLTGGLALVGERGPEVVSLPTGATVHPNGTMPGGVHQHFYGVTNESQLALRAAREVGWQLRAAG
jgi:hypothetical protein